MKEHDKDGEEVDLEMSKDIKPTSVKLWTSKEVSKDKPAFTLI